MDVDHSINWTHLPGMPDAGGLAGVYSGVSADMLLVAGGCNFPGDERPWNGGVKKWYDTIYLLDDPSASWRIAGKLPRPIAYGISLTWNDKVICIGGRDNESFYRDAFMISWVDGCLITESLPDLPVPFANGCGVIAGNTIYVAGGQSSAVNQETLNNFWSLDLSQAFEQRNWMVLEPLPGPSRMLSVAATCGENVYVFSGVHFPPGKNPGRKYLTDAFRYNPGSGWTQLPALPYAVAGAPGPASQFNGQFMLLGGDDGVVAGTNSVLKEAHPGFTRDGLQFDPNSGEWKTLTSLPGSLSLRPASAEVFSPVTTPSVEWKGQIVIPGGEIKPGLRTSQVIAGSFKQMNDQ